MPSTDAALPDWARAHGAPLFAGLIRQSPEDFNVSEILGFAPSGDGEHDLLQVEKTSANTAWVAGKLALHANVSPRDVGYAGLKDRHAVTTQWFSVRRPSGEGTDWDSFDLPDVRIIANERHNRKLKRGAHRGNEFRLIVRESNAPAAAVNERLKTIAELGVPNYFGSQRFGFNGNNIGLARSLFSGSRLRRDKRSIALSAARSYLFNEILAVRVEDGSWSSVTPGEAVNLDGTGSIFNADSVDSGLIERVRTLDVHPTCALWGCGELPCSGESADQDRNAAARHPDLASGLEEQGVSQSRRATRLNVRRLDWDLSESELELRFQLGRGGYATSVLRELMGSESI
jgi:tRNA pseudouridine13 synthase